MQIEVNNLHASILSICSTYTFKLGGGEKWRINFHINFYFIPLYSNYFHPFSTTPDVRCWNVHCACHPCLPWMNEWQADNTHESLSSLFTISYILPYTFLKLLIFYVRMPFTLWQTTLLFFSNVQANYNPISHHVYSDSEKCMCFFMLKCVTMQNNINTQKDG